MPQGLNRVTLLGFVGSEPELKTSASNVAFATVNVATHEMVKMQQNDPSNSYTQATEWHRIIFFAKTAEACAKALKKGDMVFIEGKLKTKKWTDKENKAQYQLQIIGSRFDKFGLGTSTMLTPAINENKNNEKTPSDVFVEDDIPF